jgi:hypothetical protein
MRIYANANRAGTPMSPGKRRPTAVAAQTGFIATASETRLVMEMESLMIYKRRIIVRNLNTDRRSVYVHMLSGNINARNVGVIVIIGWYIIGFYTDINCHAIIYINIRDAVGAQIKCFRIGTADVNGNLPGRGIA